ncbi:MAG: cytochrome P460 family protein [Planctomycetia bacterium]|nr:cytochrome P460 family protein [Planctomycetia bacterium]
MRGLTIATACWIACGFLLAFRQSTSAQEGSGSSRSSPQRATRPMTPDEFYQSFWKHLNKQENPYKKWGSLPGRKDIRAGTTPHGEFLRIYANKIAIDDPKGLPYGSILVTENYGADQETLKDITVMYRSKGAAPQQGDWYWLKYQPDGTIARTPEKEGKKAIAGKVTSCIECHSKAGGKDLVYSNDPEKEANEK